VHPHPRAAAVAAAVAERDSDRLAKELTEDVRLRALLPTGPLEVHGRDEVVATFRSWFADYRVVALHSSEGDEVGDRLVVHYRLSFEPDEDPHVLSQTWVCTVAADGRLARVDLLCSGFRRP
jgi:ketosteroid isomerase-like protein